MSSSISTPLKPNLKKPAESVGSPNPLNNLNTPDKLSEAVPRRGRKRNLVFSINQVRQIAQTGSHHQTDQIKSARRQIDSWLDETPTVVKPKKKIDESAKLPPMYGMLAEFFDCLDSSIRLLRLKGSRTSFTNISPKIECLTDRRFSRGHLAQLKYILPESVEIKRMLFLDKTTSCMKPDHHVMINVDAIESDNSLKSESKNLQLRKIFRRRLWDFYKSHSEECEIPEAELPELFNVSKKDFHSDITKAHCLSSTEVSDTQQPAVACHLPSSFQRHFSHKVTKNVMVDKTSQKSSELSVSDSVNVTVTTTEVGTSPACLMSSSQSTPQKANDSSAKAGESTLARLMTATPTLRLPKRCYMSPDYDSSCSPNKLVKRPPRARSLKFDTPMKNEMVNDEVNDMMTVMVDNDDIHDILPESLLQSIREKERKIKEEEDPAISHAKRRRQMIRCLPKLFHTIHFLFQSLSRSLITKEELIHKIIATSCDIVDRRAVEEQLKLLLELVPEWITENLSSSGDLVIRISTISSPESVCARLEEAK